MYCKRLLIKLGKKFQLENKTVILNEVLFDSARVQGLTQSGQALPPRERTVSAWTVYETPWHFGGQCGEVKIKTLNLNISPKKDILWAEFVEHYKKCS
jgi:hypothetical protein